MLCVFLVQWGDSSTCIVEEEYPARTSPELLSNLLDSFRGTFGRSTRYPSYYIGSYINESGQLIILTLGESSAISQELTRRCQGTGFKIYSEKDFEKQLCQVAAILQNFRYSFSKQPIIKRMKYLGCQITEGGTKICVILGNDSEATIRKFKRQVMDSPLFVFKKSVFEIGCEK